MDNKNVSAIELSALNKVISYVMGNTTDSISEAETEIAKECLKKFADKCPDWNDKQKKEFKSNIDSFQNPSNK